MFCPVLQKVLKPIYYLTKNERPFLWTKVQEPFEKIKARLLQPPVLHFPDNTRKVPIIFSKRLPHAAVNYLITVLELLGLCVNISPFRHLLAK